MLKGQLRIEEIMFACCNTCKYKEAYSWEGEEEQAWICMKLNTNFKNENHKTYYCDKYKKINKSNQKIPQI